jgi:hypothetical protein
MNVYWCDELTSTNNVCGGNRKYETDTYIRWGKITVKVLAGIVPRNVLVAVVHEAYIG